MTTPVAQFDLAVPRTTGGEIELAVKLSESLFILGANGTGKSALMHRFYRAHSGSARRLSAHRRTWFESNALTLTGAARRQVEQNILSFDKRPDSRWMDHSSAERSYIAVYDLIDAENVRARDIADAVDHGDLDLAKVLSKKEAPIKIINELLRLSNLPIEVAIQEAERIVARKSGGSPYSIAELSDGERNALLIAATVLTVKGGTLILIDEPERHLHRSIISPLLSQLFSKRPDCAFVVSTHEVMLPLDNPSSRTLLVRSCSFSGDSVAAWEADLIPPEGEIADDIRHDILGARRTLLFVEGADKSLDKGLYSLVFPDVSVIAKSTSRDVEHAVEGIRGANNLHWLDAFGVVDNDGRTTDEVASLKKKGIYALSVFAIESIYYHPDIQRRVTERYAAVTGDDVATRLANAKAAALAAVTPHIERLSARVVEKGIRAEMYRHLPGKDDVTARNPIKICIDVPTIVTKECNRLQGLLDDGDLSTIVSRYPVRETAALSEIAQKLGFQNREQYESAVRKLLIDDKEALSFVVSLFDTLALDITHSSSRKSISPETTTATDKQERATA
jgi:ABC-type cobalamin/Fe3+-siderophores transport system ATPase subunit